MFFRDDGYGQEDSALEKRLKKLEKLNKTNNDDTFSLTSSYVHDDED